MKRCRGLVIVTLWSLMTLNSHLVVSQRGDMTATCNTVCADYLQAESSCLAERSCYDLNDGQFDARVWSCMQPCREIPRFCINACIANFYGITRYCNRHCSQDRNCRHDCFTQEFETHMPLTL